ncbi:hypothetical protein ROZALSC1DRAFT_26850 [Rozella allomycis CSF55]|uniref:Inositol-pentakisphosphate 2-kinase n=1 Tax=Rozella allomycis (strain CSF55) TaxID=988480 RepID=A0A075AYA3_ROZAC|nr:hypothetical protein O9G_001290 [Rozella allomycis CSF55]RKP21744.1 hypothetical protein ROZALSC1DRAFT_26850 [Rozella allomycis CSF55]|eukprot:EPZ33539.1 hypothetical protein O9G_001290 [Rozella allomycis CSF55]
MLHAEWKLYAEGGANIIFKYTGKNIKYKNTLLRVSKTLRRSDIEKSKEIVCKYIGTEYYSPQSPFVFSGKEFLDLLSAHDEVHFRDHSVKSMCNTISKDSKIHGLLINNISLLNHHELETLRTVSIEIKHPYIQIFVVIVLPIFERNENLGNAALWDYFQERRKEFSLH